MDKKNPTTTAELSARINEALGKLNLEQKCALLSGATAFGTRAYPEFGIPELQFSDGPHGLRHQSEGANHLGIGGSLPATCFPTAVTLANSWDESLASEMGTALGLEAKVQGVNVLLGPGLCLKRSPLCGRNFEYYSEDPYLAGKMAAAFVRGVQSEGVAACPKHYAVNSQETRRQASDSVLDERTLRELYLTAFEIVVREAAPMTIMSSYNLVNGCYANEHELLLKKILRDEWGFSGAVVTDWGASVDHVAGVKAGSTFEMPEPGLDSVRELVEAVRGGRLSESVVDERVREALSLIFATDAAVKSAPRQFDIEAHHQLAKEVASRGIVLMKNDCALGEQEPVLPLKQGTRVALIGDFAETPRYQGAGSSLVNCTKLDTLLEVMQESQQLELLGFEPGFDRLGQPDEKKLHAAEALAQKADVAVLCLGLSEVEETEGADRRHMNISANQLAVLAAIRKVCSRVVVLLSAGSAVSTEWVNNCDALVYGALGGQAGASAALDVLTGVVNPSGHLAESWPLSLDDTPTAKTFPSDATTAEYREGLYVGYRYYQKAQVPVAFPFGFGLSYTSFLYSDAELEKDAQGNPYAISMTLTNSGRRAGAEVVQLYVAQPDRAVFGPEQELKGFARVELEPGESRRLRIALDDKAFRYFNVKTHAWEVEGGSYELRLASSSEDIRLVQTVEVASSGAVNPYEGKQLSSYESGQITAVSDKEFSELLGRPLPDSQVSISRKMCFRDLGHSRSPLLWLVGAILEQLHQQNFKKGAPNLNIEFLYNMPLHAIAKMAPPVPMSFVDALVREAKGWGVLGAVPTVCACLLGWGPATAALVWIAWILLPLAGAFVVGSLKNARFAKKLS